jgi:type I restriction enzyme S subunit
VPVPEPADELAEALLRRLGKSPLVDEDLPSLPEGWCWTRLDQITKNYDGKRIPVKASDRDSIVGEYPYYGASGIIDYVNDFLFDGNYLLIAEDGANLLSRSTPIAFEANGKFWVNNHAHVVRTLGDMPLGYLEIFVNSLDLKFYITGTAQPKLTQANMNKILVPLPPLAEQRRIVAEVERRLSMARQVESAVEIALARAARLRQAVLKAAFEGKL